LVFNGAKQSPREKSQYRKMPSKIGIIYLKRLDCWNRRNFAKVIKDRDFRFEISFGAAANPQDTVGCIARRHTVARISETA